jgi:hypothetical protein
VIQLSPLRSNSSSASRVASAPVDALASRARAPITASSQNQTPLQSGLASEHYGLNEQTTALQQVGVFVGEARNRLSGLIRMTGDQLAGQSQESSALQASLDSFSGFWNQRTAATSASLDSRLNLVAPGQARQAFSVDGLTARDLASGEAESVRFSLKGRQSDPVAIDPGLPSREQAGAIDRVLAPLGVRVTQSAGELQFNAAEADWAAVRDGLMVKGEGRRFPTGQYSLLRTSANGNSIDPGSWKVSDQMSTRQTLQAAFVLDRQLEKVADQATGRLESISAELARGTDSGLAARNARFAEGFRTLAVGDASFKTLSALLPSVSAMDRGRVRTLLSW